MGFQKDGTKKDHYLYRPGDVFVVNEYGILKKSDELAVFLQKEITLNTAITIPARLASTRFPNKMLAELNGVPLIRHVYDRCVESGFDTYVVTPDQEILDVIGKDNTLLVGDAENGTARCVLAAQFIIMQTL